MPKPEFCLNCRAWHCDGGIRTGECRRKSPICPPAVSEIQTGRFPMTDGTTSCMEWIPARRCEVDRRKKSFGGSDVQV